MVRLKNEHTDCLGSELVVEGSVSNFEPRWIGRMLEGDNCGVRMNEWNELAEF